jgi:Putative adhesin
MNEEKRMTSFQTPTPARLRVEIPRGRIKVVAEETSETRVELTAIHGDAVARDLIAQAEVVQNGEEILVRIPRARRGLFGSGGAVEASIHAPLGSAATLSTGAGRIETTGRLGAVSASSGSGAIRLEETGEAHARTGSGEIDIASASGGVDAKTGSGRIAVGKAGGDVRIITGSGHAELGEAAGAARVTTASGGIEVDQTGDSLEAFAASGRIDIRRADHGRVRARTISGEVSVGVAGGTAALLDITTISGRVDSQLDAGAAPAEGEQPVELTISTMSGNVRVARA